MATPVPYVGAPEVSPQLGALPSAHVDTPTAAFGGAVAGAITHAGEIAEGAGKELFARAYAMQEMDQMVEADGAASDAVRRQTDRFVEQSQLKGQDAVNALPKYNEDIQKIHDDGAANLGSPLARQYYNNFMRRQTNAMYFHGAILAKQGQTLAAKQSTMAKADAISSQVATTSPDDDVAFNRMIPQIQQLGRQAVMEEYGHAGWEPGTPQFDDAVTSFNSKHISKVIKARIDHDPTAGKALLDRMVKAGGMLTPEDADKLGDYGEHMINDKESRVIGGNASRGIGIGLETDQLQPSQFTPALKAASAGGGYDSAGPDIIADGQNKGHQVGFYGVNSLVLPQLLAKAGHPGMSEAEFRSNPEVQDEVAKQFGDMQRSVGGFAKALKAWTGVDDPGKQAAAQRAAARATDPAELARRAAGAAEKADPGNVNLSNNTVTSTLNGIGVERRLDTLTQFKNYGVATRAVDGTGAQDGKVPMTKQEYLQIPGVRDAYMSLTDKQRDAIDKRILDNSKTTDGYVPNPKGNATYAKLIQQLRDPTATPQDREEALNFDLNSAPLTRDQRMKVMDAQDKVINQQGASPVLGHALGLGAVQQLLYDNSISKGTDEYRQFITSYHDALQSYGLGAHRSVKDDETMVTIAQQLVQHQASSWLHWTSGTSPIYQGIFAAKPGLRDSAVKAFKQVYGRDPSDAEMPALENDMLRKMFEAAGAKSSAPATTKRTNRAE